MSTRGYGGLSEFHAETMPRPAHQECLSRLSRGISPPFDKTARRMLNFEDWTSEAIRAIEAPTLLIIGDADSVRPEHAVEMFRLLGGGGVMGDLAGLPNSQLAILPGTTHVTVVNRGEWLASIIRRVPRRTHA